MDKVIIAIATEDDHDVGLVMGEGLNLSEALEDLVEQHTLDMFPDEQYRKEEGVDKWTLEDKLDPIICSMEMIMVHATFGGFTKKAVFPAYGDVKDDEVYNPQVFDELVHYIANKLKRDGKN